MKPNQFLNTMKKLTIIIFLLFSSNAFASLDIDKDVKKFEKKGQKSLKCFRELEILSDKEQVKCLKKVIMTLDEKVNLQYRFYINTLELAGIDQYEGGLRRNVWYH